VYVINQQQLQSAAYVVQRVAKTHHKSCYSMRLLIILTHTKSNMHTIFILFYLCLADQACVTDYTPSYVQ